MHTAEKVVLGSTNKIRISTRLSEYKKTINLIKKVSTIDKLDCLGLNHCNFRIIESKDQTRDTLHGSVCIVNTCFFLLHHVELLQ